MWKSPSQALNSLLSPKAPDLIIRLQSPIHSSFIFSSITPLLYLLLTHPLIHPPIHSAYQPIHWFTIQPAH